jgi:hypothetical protein
MLQNKKVYCQNCIHYRPKMVVIAIDHPCVKHQFYNRNKNNNCEDYKRKWWMFWEIK